MCERLDAGTHVSVDVVWCCGVRACLRWQQRLAAHKLASRSCPFIAGLLTPARCTGLDRWAGGRGLDGQDICTGHTRSRSARAPLSHSLPLSSTCDPRGRQSFVLSSHTVVVTRPSFSHCSVSLHLVLKCCPPAGNLPAARPFPPPRSNHTVVVTRPLFLHRSSPLCLTLTCS